MNLQHSIGLIKGATRNASLKYVLRSMPKLSLHLGKRKQDVLSRIDEEAAEYKFMTHAITLSDYFTLKTTYSKDLAEIASKHNKEITKADVLRLYKLQGTASHHQFEFLLLQKLSECVGDLTLEEIVECLKYLKIYEKKVTAFQFEVLSSRILELSHLITSEALIQIVYLFGKFDSGSDELWDTLAKIFLFQIHDLKKCDVLDALRGFAGANRGSNELWEEVARYFSANCQELMEEEDYEFAWIMMRVEVKSTEFWVFLNRNFERILKHMREAAHQNELIDSNRKRDYQKFYRFFKYSIVNILKISQVNQIDLIDALVEERKYFDSNQSIKLLKLLGKHKLLSQKIVDAFQQGSTLSLPGQQDASF